MHDRWLTPMQVAELLGLHLNTVKRLSPRDLPYWRFGVRGDRKYARSDVESFIERRMVR